MGQGQSSPIDPDTPPSTLKDRSLAAVADLVKDGGVKDIVVLTGAGISTAAGIPDFRSPKTGLYHNLQRLNLPHAEDVFELEYFRENPYPFYMLAKELYPGKFHPTVSHAFVALLAKKGLLRMLFTQNIDCLERRAGVPGDKIVEAHGSFATQRCIDCKTEFPDDKMLEHVEKGEPPHCGRSGCGGLVKPDIVFFGEQLPPVFYDRRDEPTKADLVLVLGTSLTVQPFASLPLLAGDGVPRVLFNKERVGDLGHRADDVLVLGDCDSGVRRLADALGWTRELEALWRGAVGDEEAERQIARLQQSQAEAEDEVDRLVQGVEEKLAPVAARESRRALRHGTKLERMIQRRRAQRQRDAQMKARMVLRLVLKARVERMVGQSASRTHRWEADQVAFRMALQDWAKLKSQQIEARRRLEPRASRQWVRPTPSSSRARV